MADDAPAPPSTGLEAGRQGIRVGSYRILQALGTGGMSSVFKAEHVESGVVVAVKVLPRNLARNKTLLQRFLREAKSAEALEHPNVVAIYDHGTDDGRYYLVLEYVEGGDLHDWVRSHGPMQYVEAIGAIRAVAEGLRFAAGLGVIHRDIKPANILRAVDGRIKIADLGLALQADDEDERVTREGTTVGTVDYMAPEQARDSRATSVRSDIYSLGCTFFFLLTGQPPYPGGDVTEKLTRHVTAPLPEVSAFRPDASPALNRLVQRMLAKKPEQRFASYADLIAALDALPKSPFASGAQPQPSDEPPLVALLDDEPSGDVIVPPARKALPAPSTQLPALSMADLAELDESDSHPAAARRRASPDRPKPIAAPVAVIDAPPSSALGLGTDSSIEQSTMPATLGVAERPMTASERSWIITCVAIGFGLIVFVIGSDLLIHATSTTSAPPLVPDFPKLAPLPPEQPDVPAVVATTATAQPKPAPAPVSIAPKPAPLKSVATAVVAPPMFEPSNPIPERVIERSFPSNLEARFRPDWATQAVAPRFPGKLLVVRRIFDLREANMHPNVASALDVVGVGTIEIADNGPFFEDDLRVVGEARALRARAGFRPILCFESTRVSASNPPVAFSDLAGRELVLDGLDLVVDVKSFPPNQNTLFLTRGGKLTLRNCTITVINHHARPFSLVQAAGAERPARLRFERCLIRGAYDAVVSVTGGAADVFFDRTVVVNGQGGVVKIAGAEAGERRLFALRSVLATRGEILESSVSSMGRPRPLPFKALGTTFARLASPSAVPFASAMANAAATDLLAWDGVSNEFAGWSSWLSAGVPATARIDHLAAARTVWNNGDTESVESGSTWNLPMPFESVDAEKLRPFTTTRLDVLLASANPSPFLLEKTVDAFPWPTDSGVAPRVVAHSSSAPTRPIPRVATSVPMQAAALPDTFAVGSAPPSIPAPAPSAANATPGRRELSFSTLAPEWGGDLGRFLAAMIKPGDALVYVRITGGGTFPFTSVRLPDGVGLELEAQPDATGQFPNWNAARGSTGEALLDVHMGGLRLVNIQLTMEGGAKLKSLIRVARGHLLLQRCRLRAGSGVESGGSLIRFEARGSLPLPAPAWSESQACWPFERLTDKPTCRISESVLNAAANAVSALAGRCLVSVHQSVIIAEGAAFQLNADGVARHRFEADLSLDRCTLASEIGFVEMGPWPGAEPGPDRPWLVSTHRSVFFGTYARGGGSIALLRVDSDGGAHGTLFWQASGDAFEVPVFTATMDSTTTDARRPDVHRQWAELWGSAHVRAVTGPRAPHYTYTERPIVQRLRHGRVVPEDLFIDPTFPVDAPPARDLGADLRALGFDPAQRRR